MGCLFTKPSSSRSSSARGRSGSHTVRQHNARTLLHRIEKVKSKISFCDGLNGVPTYLEDEKAGAHTERLDCVGFSRRLRGFGASLTSELRCVGMRSLRRKVSNQDDMGVMADRPVVDAAFLSHVLCRPPTCLMDQLCS